MRAILTYHSIDDTGSPISISPADFRRHVDWLASGRLPVLPLSELVQESGATDAVSLTFDDALVNFAEHAWPALSARGLPATLFVPTDHVGGKNDWADRRSAPATGIPSLELLDWAALGRLAEEGLTLGSHGRRHLDLRRLGEKELDDEVAGSARILARETGTEIDAFAYPYGAVDARVAAAAGGRYRLACTTELRPLKTGDATHLLPRLDTFYLRRPGTLEAWGSGRFRRRIALRRLARGVRSRLSVVGTG